MYKYINFRSILKKDIQCQEQQLQHTDRQVLLTRVSIGAYDTYTLLPVHASPF